VAGAVARERRHAGTGRSGNHSRRRRMHSLAAETHTQRLGRSSLPRASSDEHEAASMRPSTDQNPRFAFTLPSCEGGKRIASRFK
jgi:hypothetical protein